MTTDTCVPVTVGVLGMHRDVWFGEKVTNMHWETSCKGFSCPTAMRFCLLSGPQLLSPLLLGQLPGNCSHLDGAAEMQEVLQRGNYRCDAPSELIIDANEGSAGEGLWPSGAERDAGLFWGCQAEL